MPTCIELLDRVHFIEGQLSLKLDLLELWEVGRGAGGCWWERDFLVIATGSLFTCLQGSQPTEWTTLALALGFGFRGPRSVESPYWPSSFSVQHGTFVLPSGILKHSLGTLQLACKNSNWKGCFKWSLLLLYKPSFKIDYKMFLNLPNTH